MLKVKVHNDVLIHALRGRYGSAEDLLRLCARTGQLRTLQRVLAAGGPRGRAALRRLCALLQATPGRLSSCAAHCDTCHCTG